MPTNEKYTVSFYTNCYEADWEYLLKEGRLKEMISRCNYPFYQRNLIINNIKNKKLVTEFALKAVENGIIDNFYFSEDYIQETLGKFLISRKSFRLDGFDGFWYSVAPLTAFLLCSTDYLLYFTADCILSNQYNENWINEGIFKLENASIFSITPFWNYYDKLSSPFIDEDESCFYDQGFSDQVFLIKMRTVCSVDFNEYNPKSEVFPIYSGNLLERRLFSYLNNHNYKRCILKTVTYIHDKLASPAYQSAKKESIPGKKLLYAIAKAKRKLRRNNLFVKALLR